MQHTARDNSLLWNIKPRVKRVRLQAKLAINKNSFYSELLFKGSLKKGKVSFIESEPGKLNQVLFYFKANRNNLKGRKHTHTHTSGWLYSICSRAQTPSSVFSALGSVSGTEAQILFMTGIIKLSTITGSCCTFCNRWYKCKWSISGILARLCFLQETMSRPDSAATPAHGVSRGGQQPSWWTDDVDYTAKTCGFVLDECPTWTAWQQNYRLKPLREAKFRKAESSTVVRKLVSDLQQSPLWVCFVSYNSNHVYDEHMWAIIHH